MLGVKCGLEASNNNKWVYSDADSHCYLCNIFGHQEQGEKVCICDWIRDSLAISYNIKRHLKWLK